MKSWVDQAGWPRTVYPHKWSPVNCRSSAGQGKFAGQRTVPCTQPIYRCCFRSMYRQNSQLVHHLQAGYQRLPGRRWRPVETVRQPVWLGDVVQSSWCRGRQSTGRQSRRLDQTSPPTTAAVDCVYTTIINQTCTKWIGRKHQGSDSNGLDMWWSNKTDRRSWRVT